MVPGIWQVVIHHCFYIFKGSRSPSSVLWKAPNIVQMHIHFSQSCENNNEESTPRRKDRHHRQEGRGVKIDPIPKWPVQNLQCQRGCGERVLGCWEQGHTTPGLGMWMYGNTKGKQAALSVRPASRISTGWWLLAGLGTGTKRPAQNPGHFASTQD